MANLIKVKFKKPPNGDDHWVFRFRPTSTQIVASNIGTDHIVLGDTVVFCGTTDVRGFTFEEFDQLSPENTFVELIIVKENNFDNLHLLIPGAKVHISFLSFIIQFMA